MKRTKFEVAIEIQASQGFLFDYTQDYANRLKWDTFLTQADLLDNYLGVGAKAYCVAKNGLGMETEYVSFNRPKGVAIAMTSQSVLFAEFYGSWNFKKMDEKSTKVLFLYSYKLNFLLIWLNPLIKYILKGNVRQRLFDLKRCTES